MYMYIVTPANRSLTEWSGYFFSGYAFLGYNPGRSGAREDALDRRGGWAPKVSSGSQSSREESKLICS